jgi:hypothetical protein
MRRIVVIAAIAMLCGCGTAEAPPTKTAAAADSTAVRSATNCPATGLWSECQLLYHLERAGVAPKVDSSAKPAEKLKGRPLIMKIGLNAMLEVYI